MRTMPIAIANQNRAAFRANTKMGAIISQSTKNMEQNSGKLMISDSKSSRSGSGVLILGLLALAAAAYGYHSLDKNEVKNDKVNPEDIYKPGDSDRVAG